MTNAIVILQKDPARVESLLAHVRSISENVFTVHSLTELQSLLSRLPIQIGVLDLDLITSEQVVHLHQQLGMEIVCTHRFPDENMWTEALAAGAIDCCFDDDAAAICRAIQRSTPGFA